MDHEFLSIVEKLAILEGRIAPKDNAISETTTKQKKPALFSNLKKKEESAIPMVGGVEFAEEKSDDVLSQVKASLVDYLKSAEDSVKQDHELLAKKKQDLDLKKKELKDLELQQKKQEEVTEISKDKVEKYYGDVVKKQVDKIGIQPDMYSKLEPKHQRGIDRATSRLMDKEVDEAIPMTLEDHRKLEVGDQVMVTGPNEYEGEFAEVIEFAPSGNFVVVRMRNGDEASMHVSDVEFHDDQEDVEDWEDDAEYMDENPNQTPAGGEGVANDTDPTYAQGGNSTYAESMSAPVKTVNVPLEEMGGSVLVEIHGDERDGFCIKRAGREMSTRFKSLEEAELALEMYTAHRAQMMTANQSADYIEEK